MDSLDLINTVLLAAIVGLIALAVRQLHRAPRALASLLELSAKLGELSDRLQPALDDLQRALARPRDVVDHDQDAELRVQAAALPGSEAKPPQFAQRETPQSNFETGTSAWPRVTEDGTLAEQIWQESSSDYSILDYLEHILCALKTQAYLESAANQNLLKTATAPGSPDGAAPTVATH